MGKRILTLLAGLSAFGLCACTTDAIPELNEDEMYQVEEYAAHLLLKYDANYEMTMASAAEIEAQRAELERRARVQAEIAMNKAQEVPDEPEAADTSGNAEGTEAASQPAVSVYTDIDDFFEEPSLEIDYTGYSVCSTYPDTMETNDWQGVVRATGGNSLVVFTFRITNTGVEDVLLDMPGKGAKFNFRINGNVSKTALRTMRLDEMGMYVDRIPAGESRDAFICIELDQQTAAQLSTVKMIMRCGDRRAELSLLN